MTDTDDHNPQHSTPASSRAGEAAAGEAAAGEAAADGKETVAPVPLPASRTAPQADFSVPRSPDDAEGARQSHPLRNVLLVVAGVAVVLVAGYYIVPWVRLSLRTVSTDDAYVNGHVTFVAPRVAGHVVRVLVDDNNRVRQGDLLVQLDKEPYEVQVAIRRAAVEVAQANLLAAQAKVRGLEAMCEAQRWQLQLAIEQVASQIAELRANVATYQSHKASLALAEANLRRGEQLFPNGAMSKEDLDVRRQTVTVNQAAVKEALEAVYASRAALGMMDRPTDDDALATVPPDLEQTYSSVRAALANLVQSAAEIGLPLPNVGTTPAQFLTKFPTERLDQIRTDILGTAPAVKQADAQLQEAKRDLAQAELDLSYCDVHSAIDGVVTRRNVNPGNNVQAGQTVMAVRSVKEIWIDANFKETQLDYLRIGQRVEMKVDMYGKSQVFTGRVTGFTMGTGSTLSLLPAENATGNFIKVVQRLPVRIEPVDYDPDKFPLFIGLSVVPYVYIYEKPTGPHAGDYLQPPIGESPAASPAEPQAAR